MSSLLQILAVKQREILVHWSLHGLGSCPIRVSQWLRIIPEMFIWVPAFLLLLESSLFLISNASQEIIKYLLDQHLSFLAERSPSLWVIGKPYPKAICLGWVTCWAVNEPAQLCPSIPAMNTAKIEATSGKHANPSCARDKIQGMLGWIAGFSRLSLNKSQSVVHPSALSELVAP